MKHRIFSLIFLVKGLCVFSQSDSTKFNEFIYNNVYKNIAAFNIKYASRSLNGAIPVKTFHEGDTFFYNPFLPDDGFKLEMKVQQLDWHYPREGFMLYEVSLDGLKYNNAKAGLEQKNFYVWGGKYFLIAVNRSNHQGEVKFISGQFFIHAIADDFRLNEKDPLSYLDFLKFKLFRYQVENISFVKKKGKKLCYTGNSLLYNKRINIELALKNIEFPVVSDYKE
jgi:hypothetical protein